MKRFLMAVAVLCFSGLELYGVDVPADAVAAADALVNAWPEAQAEGVRGGKEPTLTRVNSLLHYMGPAVAVRTGANSETASVYGYILGDKYRSLFKDAVRAFGGPKAFKARTIAQIVEMLTSDDMGNNKVELRKLVGEDAISGNTLFARVKEAVQRATKAKLDRADEKVDLAEVMFEETSEMVNIINAIVRAMTRANTLQVNVINNAIDDLDMTLNSINNMQEAINGTADGGFKEKAERQLTALRNLKVVSASFFDFLLQKIQDITLENDETISAMTRAVLAAVYCQRVSMYGNQSRGFNADNIENSLDTDPVGEDWVQREKLVDGDGHIKPEIIEKLNKGIEILQRGKRLPGYFKAKPDGAYTITDR